MLTAALRRGSTQTTNRHPLVAALLHANALALRCSLPTSPQLLCHHLRKAIAPSARSSHHYLRRPLTMAASQGNAAADVAHPDVAGDTSALGGTSEPVQPRGSKRPAEDELDTPDLIDAEAGQDDNDNNNNGTAPDRDEADGEPAAADAPMSKNQLRKLKRQKLWEEKRADKKLIRKEKRHAKQERKREAKAAAAATATGSEAGKEDVLLVINQNKQPPASAAHAAPGLPRPPKQPSTRVPVTVILDCQYESYMLDKELVSMASQATRCYSDNRKARYRANFVVSSFGGEMRRRFEQVLDNQYKNWKGVHFVEDDFVKAAHDANAYTAGPDGGDKSIPTLEPPRRGQGQEDGEASGDAVVVAKPPAPDSKKKARLAAHAPAPELEADDVDKSIVYLTADSPYTLDRLELNTSYVIGGIIDRNREKGLCYRVARGRNVRTAKLPIGEFMVLQSRHVLATNHVMEIMLKWLELGDWGAAFMHVIPTRKGGKLRGQGEEDDDNDGDDNDDNDEHEKQVLQAPGGAAATDDEGNLADVEQGTAIEQSEKPLRSTEVSTSAPSEQEPVVEVEGDNSDLGLEKNVLNQERWSAPPVQFEEVPDVADVSKKDVAVLP
ncbi:tRNA (guanine9-N1)-methyltransferase [Microdochium nivale]|nr:tRNA (guanine9-N1)-methyltransferase [Microdochium nivale]